MALAVKNKPPLPVTQLSKGLIEALAEARTPSPSGVAKELRTSQKETFSEGTILGLKDIFYENEPDLTYYCSRCGRFISLLSLRDHKAFHNALSTLEFSHLPNSIKTIIAKRKQLLKNLKQTAEEEGTTLNIKKVHQVDDAYEILKQELEDTFESCCKIDEDITCNVDSYDLACSVGCVSAIGHCSDPNSRWKAKMEDCKVYQDCFGNDPNKAFIGLYDGHNGRYASAVAANELHYLLLRELAKFDSKISCKCTYNMLEENDISQFDLIRPPAVPCGHTREMHKESSNFVHQVIYTCEKSDDEGTNHLSSHHPIKCKPSEESLSPVASGKVKDEYSRHMKAAFKMAYKLTDRVLAFGGDEKSRVRWSGCSAVTLILENVSDNLTPIALPLSREQTDEAKLAVDVPADKSKTYEELRTVGRLHIANTGNCHAVLVRDNRPYLLTKPHTYENTKERHRITSSGGTFSQSAREIRVNGISLTTRGLGNHGDPVLKALISVEPHCTTLAIDQYAQMLIIATAGVWQVFTPEEAAELLLQLLPQNRMPTPGYISPSVSMLRSQAQVDNAGARSNIEYSKTSARPGEEGAEDHLQLPVGELAVPERKSSLAAVSPRKNRSYTASVTFREDPSARQKEDRVGEGEESKNDAGEQTPQEMLDEEEDEELREIRSEDSGNEADVDTDWASTVPPNDLAVRSSLSSQPSLHRHLSKLLAERLVQSALLAGAKDNISAVVVLLPGTRLVEF
ncbi:protein phosphatase 2C-like domain-containing protein 1 [Watersipora subatra]|uniref:protein phosphatase 2C-like domain-containing protein 1 n=1 Tax=Watersipora subatra TaxID=2589382 RepID=UPI00355C0782